MGPVYVIATDGESLVGRDNSAFGEISRLVGQTALCSKNNSQGSPVMSMNGRAIVKLPVEGAV